MVTVGAIADTLARLEAEQGIRIITAVESGSRAWGHPSPDSDYDVRFVYCSPVAAYLTVGRSKDNISVTQGELDIVGWDVLKTIRLLINGNPSILEWLTSPIVYRNSQHRQLLEALADQSPHRRTGYWHYKSLARRQLELLGDGGSIKLKRYFYVLRPALAVNWMKHNPDNARVPMALPDLMAVELKESLRAAIEDLLAAKAKTCELGEGPRIPVIDEFVDQMLSTDDGPPETKPSLFLIDLADRYFHQIIGLK